MCILHLPNLKNVVRRKNECNACRNINILRNDAGFNQNNWDLFRKINSNCKQHLQVVVFVTSACHVGYNQKRNTKHIFFSIEYKGILRKSPPHTTLFIICKLQALGKFLSSEQSNTFFYATEIDINDMNQGYFTCDVIYIFFHCEYFNRSQKHKYPQKFVFYRWRWR